MDVVEGHVLLAGAENLAAADDALTRRAGRLAIVLGLGVGLGFLASLTPTHRSTRLDVLDAIKTT